MLEVTHAHYGLKLQKATNGNIKYYTRSLNMHTDTPAAWVDQFVGLDTLHGM